MVNREEEKCRAEKFTGRDIGEQRQEEMYTGKQLTGRYVCIQVGQIEEMYTGKQCTGRDVYR
jgi:hypothetical protein